jgi:tRNA A37 methylthiotransferase MiaB
LEVVVEGRNRQGKFYGKAGSYQTVLFTAPLNDEQKISGSNKKKLSGSDKPKINDSNESKISGNFVKVLIKQARPFGLEGEIVE